MCVCVCAPWSGSRPLPCGVREGAVRSSLTCKGSWFVWVFFSLSIMELCFFIFPFFFFSPLHNRELQASFFFVF